jgi:hypothetical protein
VKALRVEGLTVVEAAGWRTHNRAGHGDWGPVHGVVIHHTGGVAPSDYTMVWSGYSGLPGPCAQAYCSKAGVITMTANGRANHAGGGDPTVLNEVINESYGDAPSSPQYHEGSPGAADGNVYFYGLEVSNLGSVSDPYPAVQYEAIVKWATAICRFHGWTEKSVIGHKEWSNWKPDPIYSMVQFRRDVKALLAKKPGGSVTPPPPPNPTYEPYPGAAFFTPGRKSPIIAAMHDRLVAVGCNRYQSSTNKDVWGTGDVASYQAWQEHCGFSGSAADGIPGKTTWDLLKVPNV